MKKKLLFFKTLLVAAGLLAGANAWAQTTLYERGTTGNDWSDADLKDWVVDSDHGVTTKEDNSESTTNVTSSIENNKLKFNSFGAKGYVNSSTNTAAKTYSFTKSITTKENTTLKLTADWAGGGASGNNNSSCHVFTFGDIVFTLYGQSGGAFLKIGTADAIQIIANSSNTGTYRNSVWHIELSVNQSTNVVQYSLSTSALNNGAAVTGNGTTASAGKFNKVVIALAGKMPNWSLAQTLNSIKITEEEVASTARGINVNFTYKDNGEGEAAAIPEADLPTVTTYYDKEVKDVFTPAYPASFNTADYTYTYVSGGEEYTVTEAAEQTITLLYKRTARTKVDVVVRGKFEETELFSNTVTNIAEGESVVYGFPQYVLQGGILYGANGPYAVSTTASSTPIEVTYSKVSVAEGETPVYFNDFGGAAGLDWSTYSGGNVTSGATVELVPASVLADGIYKLVIQNNRNRVAKVKVGELEIGTLATGTNAGARVISTFTDVIVRDGAAITAVAGGSTVTDNIDYILVYKTGEASVSAKITSAGYATYCSSYPLDFSAVSGLTAYKATVKDNEVTFEKVTSVPAKTGVLLKGDADTYSIPVIASAASVASDLIGVTASTEVPVGSFVLMNGSEGVGFYKTSSTFTVGANTAYIAALPDSGEGAKVRFIGLDGSIANSITAIGQSDNLQFDNSIYNLNGQRVAAPTKGLYIVNGKKVFIK